MRPLTRRAESPHSHTSDAALVGAVAEGDHTALEELFVRYGATLTHRARWLVGSQSDAEDLVQETFCHLYRAARHIEHPERVRAYLWQVTVRRSWNLLRKRARFQRFTEEASHVVPRFGTSASEVEAIDMLSRLDLDEGALLVKRHCEEWTLDQLAEAEGVSLSTLKRRLRRATSSARRLGAGDASVGYELSPAP